MWQATVLQELPKVGLSPDPNDSSLRATAIGEIADYFVTCDKRDLLSLGKVGMVQIIAARGLADVLGLSAADRVSPNRFPSESLATSHRESG